MPNLVQSIFDLVLQWIGLYKALQLKQLITFKISESHMGVLYSIIYSTLNFFIIAVWSRTTIFNQSKSSKSEQITQKFFLLATKVQLTTLIYLIYGVTIHSLRKQLYYRSEQIADYESVLYQMLCLFRSKQYLVIIKCSCLSSWIR